MSRARLVTLGLVSLLATVVVLAVAAVSSGSPGADSDLAALKRQVAVLQEEVKAHKVFASQLSVLNVQSRIAYIDGTGFHAMATALKGGTIGSRDLSAVQKALKVASKIGWPDKLAGQAAALVRDLKALEAALKTGDAAKAYEAADAVHETQHDLSNAVYAWLS